MYLHHQSFLIDVKTSSGFFFFYSFSFSRNKLALLALFWLARRCSSGERWGWVGGSFACRRDAHARPRSQCFASCSSPTEKDKEQRGLGLDMKSPILDLGANCSRPADRSYFSITQTHKQSPAPVLAERRTATPSTGKARNQAPHRGEGLGVAYGSPLLCAWWRRERGKGEKKGKFQVDLCPAGKRDIIILQHDHDISGERARWERARRHPPRAQHHRSTAARGADASLRAHRHPAFQDPAFDRPRPTPVEAA